MDTITNLYTTIFYNGQPYEVLTEVLNGPVEEFAKTMSLIKEHVQTEEYHRELDSQPGTFRTAQEFEYMSMMHLSQEEFDEMMAEWEQDVKEAEQFQLSQDQDWHEFWEEYSKSGSNDLWVPNWKKPVKEEKPRCECGAKFTSNPEYHLKFCPLYENTNSEKKK